MTTPEFVLTRGLTDSVLRWDAPKGRGPVLDKHCARSRPRPLVRFVGPFPRRLRGMSWRPGHSPATIRNRKRFNTTAIRSRSKC